MITPQLRNLYSNALEPPALPADPANCSIHFQASIGPSEGEGEEVFTFAVVTPKYLAHNGLPCWGRGLLIVEQFSWPTLERALARLLAHAPRGTWQEVAQALHHDLHWENSNSQPPAG